MKILIRLIRKVEHDFRKKIRIRGKNLKFWKSPSDLNPLDLRRNMLQLDLIPLDLIPIWCLRAQALDL